MSLLNLAKPKATSAIEIERSRPALRDRVLELEKAIAESALDAYSGDAAAIDRHKKISAELAAANERLHLANQAHAGAVAREAAQLEAQRAAIRETQRQACRKHLRTLGQDAEALAASLADSVRLYQQVLDRASKVIAAWPIGTEALADNTGVAPGAVRQALIGELWRLSAPSDPINGDRMQIWPGASCPDISAPPEAIPPFASKLRAAAEDALHLITKGQAE